MGLTGIDELVFVFFIFLSICRFGGFSLSKFLIFLSICRFEGLEVNLHILKKDQHFDAKSAQNLHILKKIKRIKHFRLYVGLTGIEELVFDFF